MLPDLTRRPRTKRVFSDADMVRMRDLYYDRDMPLTRVAASFDVPVSTFLRWVAEMDWPRRTSSGPGSGRAVYAYATPHPVASGRSPLVDCPPPQGGREQTVEVTTSYPAPRSSNAGEDRAAKPFNVAKLAEDLRRVARKELSAMGDITGPMTLAERRERADIIASLSRSIARVERTVEARVERIALKQVVKNMKVELRKRANSQPENPAFAEAEGLLLSAITDKLRKIAAPDSSREKTPAPDDGRLTRPEFRQWWIDNGFDPP